MPSKSKKQHNLMMAVAHSPAFAKKVGIPQSVGKDFAAADKGRKFKEGGTMATKEMHSEKGEMKKDIAQDKKLIKKAFGMHDKQEHKGEHTNLSKLKKGGMAMKKMAMGGATKYDKTPKPSTMAKDVEAGSNKLLSFGESAVQKRGHTRGKNLGDSGPIKGIMGGAKNMAKGGSASARADGCAVKGKTKGTMMCMGGKSKAK
jgi:hypothetical protein